MPAISIKRLLEISGGSLAEGCPTDLDTNLSRISELDQSTKGDLCFYFSNDYTAALSKAHPSALVTNNRFLEVLLRTCPGVLKNSAVIICRDPYLTLAYCSQELASVSLQSHSVHPTAVVDKSAKLGTNVSIGAFVVVGKDVVIGDSVSIGAGSIIGDQVVIGDNSKLFSRVTLYSQTRLGMEVTIHSGSVIGADGFGYAPKVLKLDENKRPLEIEHVKIIHTGNVQISDFVEIGANSCVDRGTFGSTLIGKGTKIDNHVHIGHNAKVGKSVIICGGVCLAGHAHIGDGVVIGGMAGVTNGVGVLNFAKIGAMTLVTKDVEPYSTAVGNPQREHREHFKAHALLNKLTSNHAAERGQARGDQRSAQSSDQSSAQESKQNGAETGNAADGRKNKE